MPNRNAINLKLNATFAYGIFNRPAFLLKHRLVRVDLCKLPPELGRSLLNP